MGNLSNRINIRKSLNAIGSTLTRLSYERHGQISAVTLGVPLNVDKNLVKVTLRSRLSEAGIDFIHINCAPSKTDLHLIEAHFHEH